LAVHVQIQSAFYDAGSEDGSEGPHAPSGTPMTLSDGGVAGAVADPTASQRLALKQDFLLSIVGRQVGPVSAHARFFILFTSGSSPNLLMDLICRANL
jgi:hypothetical protein